MDWRDEGVLLSMRKHGESAAIIEVFTPAHGRHAGVVRGGGGRRMAPILQPGNQLSLDWRARLEDHIGAFTVEPLRARAPALMADRAALAGLSATCALLSFSLPEREPHAAFYSASIALFDRLGEPGWEVDYLRWEMQLLDEMGYGLDLATCAVTGSRDDLAYVSPKTGRAVSRKGAGEYAPRLLKLPEVLMGQGPASAVEIAQGLTLTGHFLANRLVPELGRRTLPEARQRLVDTLARQSARPSDTR
ncbi:DNA repair protein RecO [Acidimangrovimonas sediminis]|uniref:DNA repair protein RecO n=1 Tax=Acidimangrovimonas sediminis TaxID=2056283 RepID=UPI000C80578C|nr:DNA repair protein RecO [Acidimangrovimonas sediminis]